MLKRLLCTFFKLLLFVAYFVGLWIFNKYFFDDVLYNSAQYRDPTFVPDASYPGDDIFPRVHRIEMSAIVIEGTPEQVWPWLTQIGQDKAGWYSYSLFENMFGANITNLDYLLNLPEPVVGDKMWMAPNTSSAAPYSVFGRIKRPEYFVMLMHWGEDLTTTTTWAWILRPIDATHTRLILRMRGNEGGAPTVQVFSDYIFQPIHLMMERKMMQGVKERVEGRVPAFWRLQVEPIAYIVLFVEWLVYGVFGVLSMSAQGTQALVLSCISAFTLLLATVPHLPECVTVMLALLFLSAAPHLFSSCCCRRSSASAGSDVKKTQ